LAEAQIVPGFLPDSAFLAREFLIGMEGDRPRDLRGGDLPHLLADESLAPPGFWRETDWHINEVKHLNYGRGWWLRQPWLAPFLRDQHETNRLLLIGTEKLACLLAGMEKRLGTYFARSRGEQRTSWVHRYRFLGRRWRTVNAALRELRYGWEQGRHPRRRLHGRYGQLSFDTGMETALSGLCEIHATLHGFFEEAVNGAGEAAPFLDGAKEEERMASALWHSREGPALRARPQGRIPSVRGFSDVQGRLNRLYGIALEELSALLKGDLQRLGIVRSLQPDTVPMEFLQCD